MLNQLKKHLGIVDLAGIIRDHIRFEEEHRLAMNDHLAEIKEWLTVHETDCQEKSAERHNDVMARIGMVLTELQKRDILPLVRSGYMQLLPLEETLPVEPMKIKQEKTKKAKGK
ncbi:hypothetical protein Cva_01646 [Caedimonas varicaedens]|uniref:Uncharacterized protein n=1 Tax=Caedimonas varicaedens TaxID=1629334 RepID=A0A0K8MEP0_9PROT|nr:hypothetical protein Cva_01646 [Caedimonas varicaedens]